MISHFEKPRWQLLGIPVLFMERRVADVLDQLKDYGLYLDNGGIYTSAYGRRLDLMYHIDLLQLFHLQFPVPPSLSLKLEQMAELGKDYFTGAWRGRAFEVASLIGLDKPGLEIFDATASRQHFRWFEELRWALLANLLLGRGDDLVGICDYVQPDLFFDEGGFDRSKADNAAYQLVAKHLRREVICLDDAAVKLVETSRGRRAKLIWKTLQAAQVGDVRIVSKSIQGILEIFRDKEFDPDGRALTSWDASILWNIAEAVNCQPVNVPEELRNFVITRASLGIT